MTETFYHVDKHGELEAGESMELEWPPRIKNRVITGSPDSNEEILKKEYPNGLSRHGARYAQSALIVDDGALLNEGWEAMSGVFDFIDTEEGARGKQKTLPYQVQYEWIFELIRRAEFEEAQSRFQSYYAWPSLEDAEQFITEHRDENQAVFKLRCNKYELHDMDLIQLSHIGSGLANARQYWKGEAGSDTPTWEVVMEPPVDVVEQVDFP